MPRSARHPTHRSNDGACRARRVRNVVLLSVTFATAACVREERQEPAEATGYEVVWNFPTTRTPPAVRLWPPNSSTPERLKRALVTDSERGRLSARVDGKDPYFVWRFDNAVRARLVSVDIESSEPGSVQLFWSSAACPTFRESCSSSEQISAGPQSVDFLIDPKDPVREIRFDLPEKMGVTVWISAMAIFERADMSARWSARPGATIVGVESYGVDLVATEPDPWMTVTTPGLDASRVDTVELVLHGVRENDPQLFWEGPCGHFDESCSVAFRGADAGAATHRADLRSSRTWRGPIRSLRLDPAQAGGEYVIESIRLSRERQSNRNEPR